MVAAMLAKEKEDWDACQAKWQALKAKASEVELDVDNCVCIHPDAEQVNVIPNDNVVSRGIFETVYGRRLSPSICKSCIDKPYYSQYLKPLISS